MLVEALIFISYLFFAVLLFLFLNVISKKLEINKLEYILFTNIFIIFIAALASSFHLLTFCNDVFLIVVFEFLIRMIYTTYLLDKDFFAKEEGIIPLYVGNVVVCYFVNQFIIRQVETVFLDAEQLKFLLWVFIILFLYHFFHKSEKLSISIKSHAASLGEKKQYIVSQYTKMKQRYGKNLHVVGDVRILLYALMIYENYKKPAIFRQFEYFKYQFDHIPKKQGIMQINSKKIMSDIESIEYVEKKIEKYQDNKKVKKTTVNVLDILKSLGKKKDEALEIEKVYYVLKEFIEL